MFIQNQARCWHCGKWGASPNDCESGYGINNCSSKPKFVSKVISSLERHFIVVGDWKLVIDSIKIKKAVEAWLRTYDEFHGWVAKQYKPVIETFNVDLTAMSETDRSTFLKLAQKYKK